MLKFINLFIWIVLLILIIILYFQNIDMSITFSYFSGRMWAVWFIMQIILFAFLAWVFLTLWLKWLLSSDNDVGDDFKL